MAAASLGPDSSLVVVDSHGHAVTIKYLLCSPGSLETASQTPAVLLAGWNASLRAWTVNSLPLSLAAHRPVLLMDNRGVRSSLDAGQRWAAHTSYELLSEDERVRLGLELSPGLSLSDLAEDVQRVVSHLFPQRSVHLIGCSMGGMVAQCFAVRYPALLASLLLVTTTADFAATGARMVARSPPAGPMFSPMPIPLASRPPATEAEKQAVEQLSFMQTLPWQTGNEGMLLGRRHRDSPDFLSPLLRLNEQQPASTHAFAVHQRAMLQHRLAELLSSDSVLLSRPVPTLIVGCEDDPLMDETAQAELLRLLPHATLVTMAGVGHVPTLEAPDELLSILSDFMSQQDARSKV